MSVVNTLFIEDYWNVGIIEGRFSHLIENKMPDIQWYPKTKSNQFLADPFLVNDPVNHSLLHIFCEIFSFKTHLGRIGHFTYNAETKEFSELETVLEEPYHLAYPFIIESNGEIFMIPETAENSEVSLYKAQRFPKEWKKVSVLIDNYQGIDNSVLYKDNMWWLFSTDMKRGQHSYLNIHYSEDLQKNWIAHPQNPVKSGKDFHRSAGTPFKYDGELIRPSMNCVKKYGESIILNRITTLTKKKFEEEIIGKISAFERGYFKDKIHTIAKAGNFTVVDGCRETLFFLNPHMIPYKMRYLSEKLSKRFGN